ncbi:MAG: hypothetical protein C0407_09680 [Desulfobacca sp.]|nr:hypothetical protein [Desulfobacca sp.]
MARVKKLSGKNCLYYKLGRCAKPGESPPPEEQLCILVVERKRMGQNTLDRLKRLERFGLTIHDRDGWIAQRYIVSKNLNEMAKISCKNFIESGLNYPHCIHQVRSLCLLKSAACSGRCPEFSLERKKSS